VEFSGITKIDVDNDDDGDYHLITFVLADKTGLDLRFRPITSNANDSPFWIQPIALGCPTAAATMPGVVEPLLVSPSGKELTVINYNAVVEELRFALRLFEGGNPAAGHDYDPIMNNQNGGGRFDWASAATVAAVAASAGALLYVGLRGGLD
jgi:hypothetical protein